MAGSPGPEEQPRLTVSLALRGGNVFEAPREEDWFHSTEDGQRPLWRWRESLETGSDLEVPH